jgi:hypothetical protein
MGIHYGALQAGKHVSVNEMLLAMQSGKKFAKLPAPANASPHDHVLAFVTDERVF